MQIPELSNDIHVATRDGTNPVTVGRATEIRPLYVDSFTLLLSTGMLVLHFNQIFQDFVGT